MTRKFLLSMTLISLFAFLATNLSFGKEEGGIQPNNLKKCSYTYFEMVRYEGLTHYIPHTVELGTVANSEAGDAVCNSRIKTHMDSFHNDI